MRVFAEALCRSKETTTIPSTLLKNWNFIPAVVVGADRVAKNGDTANKIGTYQIAILAKYHNVPFYVAAPCSCHCDITDHGNDITIEERAAHELTSINGVKIAAQGMLRWTIGRLRPWQKTTVFIFL